MTNYEVGMLIWPSAIHACKWAGQQCAGAHNNAAGWVSSIRAHAFFKQEWNAGLDDVLAEARLQ